MEVATKLRAPETTCAKYPLANGAVGAFAPNKNVTAEADGATELEVVEELLGAEEDTTVVEELAVPAGLELDDDNDGRDVVGLVVEKSEILRELELEDDESDEIDATELIVEEVLLATEEVLLTELCILEEYVELVIVKMLEDANRDDEPAVEIVLLLRNFTPLPEDSALLSEARMLLS